MTNTVKNTKVTPATLKRLAEAYVKAETKVDGNETDAARKAYAFVLAGGKAADLTETYKVAKSTVSKRVALGKALGVVGDVDAETVTAIKQTLTGNRGDRAALVKAVADGKSAGVVAATKATKKKSTTSKGKGGKARTVSLAEMTSAALLDLIADAVEVYAVRDDAPEHAERFVKISKSIALIAKNHASMPVA